MKILILIQCTNLGGMEHNMLLLIDEFKKMNIESEVVSMNPVGKLGKLLEERGISHEGCHYSGPGGMFSLFQLHRILKGKSADGLLMIGHNLMGEIAIGNLWKHNRALVIHYHHTGVKGRLIWILIYGIACHQFRSVGFVSDYIMNEAISLVPFLKNHSRMVNTPVITHPFVTEEARAENKKKIGIPEQCFVIGNAGWLIPRKRWDVFLDVCAEVSKEVKNARFLIAGDGPERDLLEKRAIELGIFQKIIWLGWQSNLSDFYATLDVLLFNSDWDAQPRTPLEAMSYGIPVVASIVSGGTGEVILDPSMGILLNTHDVKKLAEEVIRLMNDPELKKSIGKTARHRIEDYGSPRNHALMTLECMGFFPLDKECTKWEHLLLDVL